MQNSDIILVINFRGNLERLRKEKGLSRAELGALCSLEEKTIYNYETGRRLPRIHDAKRLADALGCTLDDLCKEAYI